MRLHAVSCSNGGERLDLWLAESHQIAGRAAVGLGWLFVSAVYQGTDI